MSTVNVSVGAQISAPGGNILPGTIMQQGQWAISANNLYVLIMQTDGNLVLYQVAGAPPTPGGSFAGYPMWATATNYLNDPGWTFAVQTDGNLVVYDASGNALWTSGTANQAPPKELSIQTDGNLVLYDTAGGVLWSTGTYVNLAQFLPTLQQGCTGRFDGKMTAWHNLDNAGDNGLTPTVVTLNSTTLLLQGGYDYSFPINHQGSGTISLEITLTGYVTCTVTGKASGSWLNFDFSSSGTWQKTGDEEPVLQLDLTDGPSITLTSFGESATWYPGIELDIEGQTRTAFENMTGISALASPPAERGRDPRPAPRPAAADAPRPGVRKPRAAEPPARAP